MLRVWPVREDLGVPEEAPGEELVHGGIAVVEATAVEVVQVALRCDAVKLWPRR